MKKKAEEEGVFYDFVIVVLILFGKNSAVNCTL